jgi:hypothetical protein
MFLVGMGCAFAVVAIVSKQLIQDHLKGGKP